MGLQESGDQGQCFAYLPPHRAGCRGPKSTKRGVRHAEYSVDSGDPQYCVKIMRGVPLTEKRSTFQAFLARVDNLEQVDWVHRDLLTDKRIATATYVTVAYRFRDCESGSVVAEHIDERESIAGDRLAGLLEACGCPGQGVFLLVARWYGSVD